MKYLLLLFLLPISLKAQDFSAKADTYLNDLYAQHKITGTVLVAKGGKIIYQKALGWADQNANKPNTVETQYRIASLTKQFTAALILQLAEEGKLSITDALSKYVPGFPSGDSITLHNLLSHTSGIRDGVTGPKAPIATASLGQKINIIKSVPLSSSPGSKFEYANANFTLLSFIAEKITGIPYDKLLKTRVLDKAGMSHSGIDYDSAPADMALGYANLNTNPWSPAPFRDMKEVSGAGGMYSTVGDLYKWDRALYTTTVLSEASKKQMFTPKKGNYGYGYVITNRSGRKEYMHTGAITGFLSVISRFPDDDACIIILCNSRQVQPPVSIKTALAKLLFGN
ncbi:MAG: hypothetical protein K0S09_1293 [Sphingobacteriaceae bacterium]|nr:hypothetical protein [Sphingobacteriaceae bacterium]